MGRMLKSLAFLALCVAVCTCAPLSGNEKVLADLYGIGSVLDGLTGPQQQAILEGLLTPFDTDFPKKVSDETAAIQGDMCHAYSDKSCPNYDTIAQLQKKDTPTDEHQDLADAVVEAMAKAIQ